MIDTVPVEDRGERRIQLNERISIVLLRHRTATLLGMKIVQMNFARWRNVHCFGKIVMISRRMGFVTPDVDPCRTRRRDICERARGRGSEMSQRTNRRIAHLSLVTTSTSKCRKSARRFDEETNWLNQDLNHPAGVTATETHQIGSNRVEPAIYVGNERCRWVGFVDGDRTSVGRNGQIAADHRIFVRRENGAARIRRLRRSWKNVHWRLHLVELARKTVFHRSKRRVFYFAFSMNVRHRRQSGRVARNAVDHRPIRTLREILDVPVRSVFVSNRLCPDRRYFAATVENICSATNCVGWNSKSESSRSGRIVRQRTFHFGGAVRKYG